MAESLPLPLKMVDGLELDATYQTVLRPGRLLADRQGRLRRLPRFFYEIPTWQRAKETELAPGFHLWEFIHTDVREHPLLRTFPRYVPCAVTLLAAHLAVLRSAASTYVHVAANGGYRSPGHALSTHASPHLWGTAANIYRVGDDALDTQETIAQYTGLVRSVLPGVWIRPYGHAVGFADDHLHLDLGYVTVTPHDAAGEVPEPVTDDHGEAP